MSPNSEKLVNLVQILTAIALIAGLGLVLLQLKQNEDLARLQLISDSTESFKQLDSAMMGEDFATTMARINNPSAKITDADLYRYDAYAFSTVQLWRRNARLGSLGMWEVDLDQGIPKNTACYFFGSDVGQAWLTSPAVNEEDEIILKFREKSGDCRAEISYLEYMRERLRSRLSTEQALVR